MRKNSFISALASRLELLYKGGSDRFKPEAWTKVISEALLDDGLAASAAVTDFLLTHVNLPSETLKAVIKAIDLRNRPADMSYIFGADNIVELLKESASPDAVSYDSLPKNISDDAVEDIVNSISELKDYLDKSQIYLASRTLNRLKALCPDNRDIEEFNVQFIEMHSTAGLPAFRLRKQRPKYTLEKEGTSELIRKGEYDQTAEYYERIISEDYTNCEAYYCLGNIYLLQGENLKADYIADLLLDTGEEPSMAMLLKGRVLEENGSLEDALFYFDTVCRRYGSDNEAELYRDRVLAALESPEQESGEEEEVPLLFIDRCSEKSDIFKEINEPDKVIDKIEETDALISRGRASEAYYELGRAAEDFPESGLIRFKTAYTLYLMQHENEARRIFLTVGKDDPLYRRARYLIADINQNIIANRKYDEIPPEDLAEILFSTGNYEKALELLSSMDTSSMTAETLSLKGRCEIEKGRLSNALDSLNAALEKDGSLADVKEIIAMLHQIRGDYDRASELFDDAINSSNDPQQICNVKASMLYSINRREELFNFREKAGALLGHPSDADGYAGLMYVYDDENADEGMNCLKDAVDAGSSNPEFYNTYAEEASDAGFYFRAMMCTERGFANTDAEESLYLSKARILYKQGRSEAAEILTSRLLADRPESAELHFLYSCIQHDLGDEAEALKWNNSAVSLDHDSHEYIYMLAERYFHEAEYDNALFYYTKAILLDEKDRNSFKRRAYIFYKKNQDQKALDDINRAMLLNPNDAETYLLIGNILSGYEIEEFIQIEGAESVGESEANTENEEHELTDDENIILSDLEKDAEYYYTKAIMYDPEFVDGYVCRAKYYTEHGQYKKAMRDIDKALLIDSESERLYMLKGIICHLAGQNEDAINAFIDVSLRDINNLTAYSYMIKCYNALERYKDALSIANEALARDPDFINIYVNRGVTYYHLEQYDKAIEDFNKVLLHRNQVNTAALEAVYKFKGLSFEAQGRYQDAITDFRMLLKYDPQSPGIRERITDLEDNILDDNSSAVTRLFRRRKKK